MEQESINGISLKQMCYLRRRYGQNDNCHNAIGKKRLTSLNNIDSIRDSHYLYLNQRSDQSINLSAIPTRIP